MKGIIMQGNNGAGKGDVYRPIDKTQFDKNFDDIFGKQPIKNIAPPDTQPKQKRNEKPPTSWIVPIEESMFFDLDETTGKETSEKKCYIRIPPEVCRKLKIRVGTPLDIRVRNGCIQVTRQIRNKKKGKTT
jgi:hypothetical protein